LPLFTCLPLAQAGRIHFLILIIHKSNNSVNKLRYILDPLASLLAIVSLAEGEQWWSYQLQGRNSATIIYANFSKEYA